MADINHLAKFREGARAWNAWREDYPGITPDLRDLDIGLGEKQLGPAHGGPIELSDALLNGANLHSATLLEARLDNADLRQANLSMALLAGADLSFANLGGAVFDNADLADASLWGAIVEGAKLDLARNLTQTQIDAALGDAHTALPPNLHMPATWRASDGFGDEDLAPRPDEDFFDAQPHEILGLGPKASPEDIRAAYLKLAKKYHPDVNPGDIAAERRFKRVNEAHRLLTLHTAPKRRRTSPWATAAILLVLAIGAPTLAVYWFGGSFDLQAPRIVWSGGPSAGLAMSPAGSGPSNATGVTGAAAGLTPVIAAPSGIGEAAAPDAESQRINTASEVQFAMPAISQDRLIEAAPGLGLPDRIVPAQAGMSPPSERLAALQPASPTPAETATAPWDEEWAKLKASRELLALHGFILRYKEKPAADKARDLFRTVLAKLENTEELQKFVRETAEDSPERALVKRQLALLVEKEAIEGDQKAWAETRERGTIAALRAYLLGFPSGMFVYQAEERLSALEEEANGRKKDSLAWAKALRTGTRAAYEAYIKAQRDGRHIADAKQKIATLATKETAARKEDEAWAKAGKQGTRNGYYTYLNAYPNGRYASAAQASIEKADRPAAAQEAEPNRTAAEGQRGRRNSEPRWPSSDEPFVERIQRAE